MSRIVFAIDPGNEYSGFCVIRPDLTLGRGNRDPFGKLPNEKLLNAIKSNLGTFDYVVEEIRSQGMATPQTAIDTARFSGRIEEITGATFIPRQEVKRRICGSVSADDSNVICALVDRFGNRGKHGKYAKGTKKNPGFFYGFADDVWQAFALGVCYIDMLNEKPNFE